MDREFSTGPARKFDHDLIRRLLAEGWSQERVARFVGCSQMLVSFIRRGKYGVARYSGKYAAARAAQAKTLEKVSPATGLGTGSRRSVTRRAVSSD